MPVRDLLSAASGASAPADPYFYDVSLLLNGDGTNGAQNNTFLDSSTNNFTITRNGNTTQGSFSPYGTLWSNYFGGSSAFTAPSSSALNPSSGNFTVEFWLNPSSIFGVFVSAGTGGLWIGQNGSNFVVRAYGVADQLQVAPPPSNTWTHIACVRNGSTITIYYNGVSQGSATSSYNFTQNTIYIGSDGGSGYTTGYISNLRYNSNPLYTSNFTPSTTPLTAVSGTSLLTCQSNRFIDNSSNNFTITPNNSPLVQRFSPFNPTAPYSTSVIGGSGYFGTSGDYLSLGTNPFSFSGGTYTLEAWVYITAYASTRNCVFIQSSTSLGSVWFPVLSITSTAVNTITLDGNTYLNFTGTVPLNTWTHVAVSKSGTSVRAFINGTQLGSAQTDSSSYTNGGQTFLIGGAGSSSSQVNGYIEDLRVNNTTALYTASFTPPTAPLGNVSGTQVLANFTNAGIPDLAMQNNLETVGSAQVSTSVVKYGTGSLAFSASGNYLRQSSNLGFSFGTGAFTIEFWVYMTTTSSANFFFQISDTAGGFKASTTNTICFYSNPGASDPGMTLIAGNTSTQGSGGFPVANTWYHIAIVRNGTTTTLYKNGTSYLSLTDSTSYTTPYIVIGNGYQTSRNGVIGYIDDFRVTSGLARYTANFTPPTSALPTY